MAKTKQTRKGTNKGGAKIPIAWRKVAIISVVVVAVIGALFCIALARRPLYGITELDAKNQLASVLDKIQSAPAKVVYSAIDDKGCNDLGSVGLAKRINCSMTGYKYFTVQGSAGEAVRSIDAILTRNGWTRPYSVENHDYAQIMDGVPADSVSYTPPNGRTNQAHPDVELAIYDPAHTFGAYDIEQLISEKKMSPPSSNETLFGVSVSETYWSCSEENLFQLPCPTPPSDLKN